MRQHGPIILIDDDLDDQEIMQEVIRSLNIHNPLVFFKNGKDAEAYLRTTKQHPFLILCDINMPVMNGLELRATIEADPVLRDKNIPFIFLSTTGNPNVVRQAYKLTVQGFFQKKNNLHELSESLRMIVEYWRNCLHPVNG